MNKEILTLNEITKKVGAVAAKYKVEAIYIFGSHTRGEATLGSDLDFLVYGGDSFKKTLIFGLAEEFMKALEKTFGHSKNRA